MCGIAGITGPGNLQNKLQKMISCQEHRGPDFTGTYEDKDFIALGHNRLAIIDLSPEANQPFSDTTGRFHLVFNGEIYNYLELKRELEPQFHFKTSSDTEVLLASFICWGKSCLEKLNGMFSFAIWDIKEKKLFAARDRFGVKPFYYSFKKKNFCFASEIKTLQKIEELRTPNERVWANYFRFGSYGLPDETFFEDIHQLPGGHFLEFRDESLTTKRWYDFESRVANIPAEHSIGEAKEIYLQLLKDSIELRFRSDVPVGFNISGGVDSSLLLALVNLHHDKKNINAYTFYTGDPAYDELPWVEQMIATTRNPLIRVKFTAEKVEQSSKEIAGIQDEPFGGIPTLAYASIFKQAARDGVKVLLDGQGMDEQWAGYDYYFQNSPASSIQGTGKKSPFRSNVLSSYLASQAEKPQYSQPFSSHLLDLQYRDLFYTKIPRALRFNDRISMASGTELREPFLDYRLVEFAFSQPEIFKYSQGRQKYMLREILKELVPQELSYAPKRPLQTPQREWLGGELKAFTEMQLQRLENSAVAHWFNFKEMKKEWQVYQKGDKHSSFHLWQWINTSVLLSPEH